MTKAAGGGRGRLASVGTDFRTPAAPGGPAAAGERASSAADQTGDPSSLFDITGSDDAFLFVDDALDADVGLARAVQPAALGSRGGDPLTGPKPPPAIPDAARITIEPRRPTVELHSVALGHARGGAAKPSKTPPGRPRRRSGASGAPASSPDGVESALRRAFTQHPRWRRSGWRGAVGIVALAASGSMAAGIAIALLPGSTPPLEPQSEATGFWTETGGLLPETRSGEEPPAAPAVLAPAAAPATASLAVVETPEVRRPGGLFLSADPVAPTATAAPRLKMPDAISDEGLAGASLYEIGARPVLRRPGDASAFAAAGGFQPSPRVLAAVHPDRASQDAAPLLADVDGPAVHPGSAKAAETSGVRTPGRDHGAAGLPGALRQDVGKRDRADIAVGVRIAAHDEPAPADPALQAGSRQARSSEAMDPETLFQQALEIAIEDPLGAVIAYARAAILGHARAAYYLGQIYETGDGVPVDLAIARHWYEASSAGNPRARQRLAELPQAEQSEELTPPLPLDAELNGADGADFVWTSGRGADPASYLVELAADPREGAIATFSVTGSAARLPLVEAASHWRVLSLDAAGGRMASDWQELTPAAPDGSAAAPAPAGHL